MKHERTALVLLALAIASLDSPENALVSFR